jgi:hypothetical protein
MFSAFLKGEHTMFRKRSFILLTLIIAGVSFLAVPAMAGKPVKYGGVNHIKKIDLYEGPQTCLGCHTSSKMGTDIAQDVFNSAHFQLRGHADFIDMPGEGSHGMIDRACGLPGTSAMANNYAGVVNSPVTTEVLSEGCGKCHIARMPPYMYNAYDSSVADDIDCLICHARYYSAAEWSDPEVITTYGGNPDAPDRVVTTLSNGVKSWVQDRSTKTAQSVGNLPLAVFCLRCHEHGLSSYKRATPYETDTDVHAMAGVECYECHMMQNHRIARGNYVTDGVANDMPEVEVDCASTCHGSAPHAGTSAAELNAHVTNVSCEVCHIPVMEHGSHRGANNIARRSWAPWTLDPNTGAFQQTDMTLSGEYPGFWDAYTEYHPDNAWPTIRWFNGGASLLAQPYGGYTDRVSEGGGSKLFAIKPFTSGMIFDGGWLPGPNCIQMPRVPPGDFDCVNETWTRSFKGFYESNWDKYIQFGFIDPAYATPASYWAVRPDMAIMLNMFPNMLQFDRAVFLAESGEGVAGTVMPGPQTAATYPGIAKAINMGMGSMGMLMYPEYFPPGSDPEFVGQGFWSGSFFAMWVPPNMDPNSAFMGEVGSFITMSHAIKGAADLQTPCFECHNTQTEYDTGGGIGKRLVFGLLGYVDADTNGVIDPMYDSGGSAVEVCNDNVDNDNDGLVDCADPDCSGESFCGAEGRKDTCSDGIDNDGDGLTDCDDDGCAKNKACK